MGEVASLSVLKIIGSTLRPILTILVRAFVANFFALWVARMLLSYVLWNFVPLTDLEETSALYWSASAG